MRYSRIRRSRSRRRYFFNTLDRFTVVWRDLFYISGGSGQVYKQYNRSDIGQGCEVRWFK